MRYVYGQAQGCSWLRFFSIMFVADAVVIVALLIGVRLYNNHMVRHDAQTISSWCQQVLCVYIDPATGIGYPAMPEVVPEQNKSIPANVEVHEI